MENISVQKSPPSSSNTKRSSLTNPETDATIATAQSILTEFTNLPLFIRNAQSEYDEALKRLPDYDSNGRKKPEELGRELHEQISFVRKLKTHYIEQTAKDKYVKTILDDEAPIITLEDNIALKKSNEEKKARLKEAKVNLQERYDSIEKLTREVTQNYQKAQEYSSETKALLQEILDKQLELSRLRSTYPFPRLTLSSAQARLESQEEEMAQSDATLSQLNEEVDEVREKLKESARDVDRLKVEHSKVEEELRLNSEGKEEEAGLDELYEWFSTSLTFYRTLFSIHEMKSISSNELAITYHISPSYTVTSEPPVPVTISLIFRPNTRQLADARLSSSHPGVQRIPISELVQSCVPSNNASLLVRTLLSRARREIRGRDDTLKT